MNGQYVIVNPTMMAFERAQNAFEGEAERLGLNDIDDVVALVREVRAERNDNAVSKSGQALGQDRMAMFGCLRGKYIIADDFNAPLDDFKEYIS